MNSTKDAPAHVSHVVSPAPSEVRIEGRLPCPPDKSLTHRAVMFSSLARGESRVSHALMGQDCRSTMDCFRALGVQIEESGNDLRIFSPGWDALKTPSVVLDCGNSGTTARLLLGILAATPGVEATLTGDESLKKRPMARVTDPLRRVGAEISESAETGRLPLRVRGRPLSSGLHVVDKASAQVKSALILAGLRTTGTTTVELPRGSRDHTERFLATIGASLVTQTDGPLERVSVTGPVHFPSGHWHVPGDPSSAAFLCVAVSLLTKGSLRICHVLNNPTRDGFLRVLRAMGAHIDAVEAASFESTSPSQWLEPVHDLIVHAGARLCGVHVTPDMVPSLVDEVPILAVAAAFADGPSTFEGLDELRVKESDRLAMTEALLRAMGAVARVEGTTLHVQGGLAQARPFTFDPNWDHRLAMSAGVAALRASAPCTVLGSDCVDVSFPDFFAVLESVATGTIHPADEGA